MYYYLLPRLGKPLALTVTAIWYAALLAGVLYSAFEPQAELKYLAL